MYKRQSLDTRIVLQRHRWISYCFGSKANSKCLLEHCSVQTKLLSKLKVKKIWLLSTQVRIGGSKKKAKPKQKLLRNSFPATMIRRRCCTLQLIVNEVVFMLIMSDFMSVIRCKLLVVNRVLEYSRTKLLGWRRRFQNRPGGTFSNQVGTAYLMGIPTHSPLLGKGLLYL